MPVLASAPGKAVLTGEYAVLYGAPAVAMAVTRRCRVTVTGSGHDCHRAVAPGYLDGAYRFEADGAGGLRWIDPLPAGASGKLVECVWRHADIEPAAGLALTLDTTAFRDPRNGRKLGLGSSAALAVALAGALQAAADGGRPVEDVAFEAHREFQGGKGSGVDVAAALAGGLIEYRVGAAAVPLRWPEGIACRLLWSGTPASTTERLDRLDRGSGDRVLRRLTEAAESAAFAWRSGGPGLIGGLGNFVAALEAYGVDRRLGIFEAGHAELADLARDWEDLVYKPCGAGGGDIGVVLAATETAADEFCAACARAGFTPLEASLDCHGLVVEGAI